MAVKSALEAAEERKQVALKGRIAREKTRQLEYDFRAEQINTQKSRLKIDSARVGLDVERTKLEGQRVDLNIARNDLQIKNVQLTGSYHKLGMAQDNTQALGAERQLKQQILAENLNSLALQSSESREANQLKIGELKSLYNKAPSTRSTI